MNKEDLLKLFCEADVFPKFILLSSFHEFLALGMSEEKNNVENENEFLVHLHPFSEENGYPWRDLKPLTYLPCIAYKDGIFHTYQPMEYAKIPFKDGPWKIQSLEYNPTFSEWDQMIDVFKESDLKKIVLSRLTTAQIIKRSSPLNLLMPLLSLSGSLFAYFTDPETLFFGLTPEHLFRRENNHFYSEALAGTRPSGPLFTEELKKSIKELEEFNYVSNYIESHLEKICATKSASQLQIKKTPLVQHLHMTYEGVLHPNFSDLDFVNSFHPTPALCGSPKDEALSWILANEPYHRGLYGSPLGWVGKNSSEFVVAIRSCLIEDEKAYFFAGSGILKESEATDEWEELNKKQQLMRSLFDQ